MKISKFFSVYPSLLKGVLFKFNPPKGPSLARSVHKPLKVPSLARSVLKPLKVPSLARSVPNLLSIFAPNLLWNRLRRQPSPFSSHVINSSGFPGESQLVLTDGWVMDGWMDGRMVRKSCFYHVFRQYLKKY